MEENVSNGLMKGDGMKREKAGTKVDEVSFTDYLTPLITMTGINLIGTIIAVIVVLNTGDTLQDSTYANPKGFIDISEVGITFVIFEVLVCLVSLLWLSAIDEYIRVDVFWALLAPILLALVLVITMCSVNSFKSEDDIIAHNNTVTIEKLKTEYDSAKKMNPHNEILESVPNSSKVSNADPYLVEKNGEEYILYVSVDWEENETKIITETKLDDLQTVKVIK